MKYKTSYRNCTSFTPKLRLVACFKRQLNRSD